MKVLVTGAAGFIGMHACQRLMERGDEVVGIDNLNAYYDPALKQARLAHLRALPQAGQFSFEQVDVADQAAWFDRFARHRPDAVLHLAAQAGVRHSLTHPHEYAQANLAGFLNVLEACRAHPVRHLVYASSSSVYGNNAKLPFAEADRVDHPVSLYAATKKANELMAHSYSHLFGLPTTGLRFFTVYGPWGRPDMALYRFASAIAADQPIDVYNQGRMVRDFTYIDDVVSGVVRVLDQPAAPDPAFNPMDPQPWHAAVPYRVYNIGNSQPVQLMDFIHALEDAFGRRARMNLLPMQAGDVPSTQADTSLLEQATGLRPATPVAEGIRHFVAWYRAYHGV